MHAACFLRQELRNSWGSQGHIVLFVSSACNQEHEHFVAPCVTAQAVLLSRIVELCLLYALNMQALIDLGFKLTTGGTEALRPAGARLLQCTLHFFSGVPDPDVPETLLLEQYQAQFVSALRAALVPNALPALSVAGGALATTFLGSGLAGGDGAVMRRLMDLLIAPLSR